MVIGCRVSKSKVTLLVVGMDGRLIRRLDAGKDIASDFAISPDGADGPVLGQRHARVGWRVASTPCR